MKNALILHGTLGNSKENWFPWLEKELIKNGYKVWLPDLPGANQPNLQRYNDFIFGNSDWKFDSESVIIGHSSGAQTVLKILEDLPDEVKIDTAVLVAGFTGDVDYPPNIELKDLTFDWNKIRSNVKRIILLHSDDDPFVPTEQGENLKVKLNAELIIRSGEKHYSISTGGEKFKELPIVLELLNIKG